MNLDLLTSNGLIIKSRYYDFNDTTSIMNISVLKQHLLFNRFIIQPDDVRFNLKPLNILSIWI